jgi:hypothetical protein
MATGDGGDDDGRSPTMTFKPNGVLRAQVIKAESCLLMGILQLTQETMTGYLKCGLNFRKGKGREYNKRWVDVSFILFACSLC